MSAPTDLKCTHCGQPATRAEFLLGFPDLVRCEACTRQAEERLARAVFGHAAVDRAKVQERESQQKEETHRSA